MQSGLLHPFPFLSFFFFFFFFLFGFFFFSFQDITQPNSERSSVLEGVVEDIVLAALEDTGDGEVLGPVVLEEVVGGVAEGLGLLLLGGTLANPGEDLEAGVENEGVLALKGLGGEGLDLDHLHLAGLVAEPEELLLELLGDVRGGGGDLLAAAEEVPELLGVGVAAVVLLEDPDVALASVLAGNVVGELGSLGLLHGASLPAVHLEDVEAVVEDEDVTGVEGLDGEVDLADNDVLLALEVEEAVPVLLGLDVLEARVHATLQEADVLEVRAEELGLGALDFAVLDRVAVEVVVELDGLVGGGAVLVLGGLGANPEVDVVAELLGVGGLLVGPQENVRVAGVELAVLLLGPGDNLELLNPPDLDADLLANSLPGILSLRSGVLNLCSRRREEEKEEEKS